MKRLNLRCLIALATALMSTPTTLAAGVIMIDPITPPTRVTPRVSSLPVLPVAPVLPLPPAGRPPAVSRPLLRGQVSFGLRLQAEAVKVDINDQVAKTYISQTFVNDTDRNLAGTYLFPLPEDTTFSSFSLHIDGKPVEGKILEANDARQQYEEIVRRMVDPGLLEYADYKTVRARIFPIPAHGSKKVELEYTQILKAENGMLKYQFPLKAQGQANQVAEMKVEVKLSSKPGLRTIWSPTHSIKSQRLDDNHARISWLATDTVADKDFLLYYSVSDKEMTASVLSHKDADQDGYFLLTLTPPLKSKAVIGKDLILIADTSGSMQGDKIKQCKQALKYVINALSPADRFDLVQFSTDVEKFRPQLQSATADNKKAALAFVDEMEAAGGTNIGDALKTAVSIAQPAVNRPAYVVLMTDGEPTVGETNLNKLLQLIDGKKNLRVFDFGVGYDVNTRLLNKLAEGNHGTSQYVEPDEDIEAALSAFYQKIKSPVLSNVHLAYQGLQVKDIYPKEVKDIFAGGQLLLLGRYKNGGQGSIQLSGTVNGELKSFNFPVSLASEESGHTYLPRLWAMRRIGHLTEIAQENGNQKEVVDEIVSLSKRFGIISAYTSYLVTDPSENHRLVDARPAVSQRLTRGNRAAGAGFMLAPQTATRGSVSALPPPPLPLAGYGAGRLDSFEKQAESGQVAVKRSRQLAEYKAKEVDESKDEKKQGVKSTGDKTFYLQAGFWTDSTYVGGKSAAPEVITFGSQRYFELLRKIPALSRYFAVGPQLIVCFKGHSYKVVSPKGKNS